MFLKDWIVKETEDWIAINKPSGLLSIPDREGKEASLKTLLIDIYKNIFVVHRIDRDTSGLIIFAKNEKAHKHLTQQFEKRETYKEYIAIVQGAPPQQTGSITNFLKEHPAKNGLQIVSRTGKEAISNYTVTKSFKNYAVVKFNIETGRTHQIRVHCKELGCPIVADSLYGNGEGIFISKLKKKFNLSKNELEERPILGRLALHAHTLQFIDVATNCMVLLEASLPKDMMATIKQLEKHNTK